MNFDRLIEENKLQKEKLINQMEEKKQEIIKELVSFTQGWYEQKIIDTIKENSEKVFALGEEEARKFKEKTSSLINNTNDVLDRHVNLSKLWWHTNENNELYFSESHRVLPELEEPMQIVFGELGKIFVSYGIIIVGLSFATKGEWSNDNTSGKMKYNSRISFSKKIIDLNNEYAKLINSCKEINGKISDIEDTKKKENIEDWWNKL